MDMTKAETIIAAAAGLKYWEWREIADMIERKFRSAQAFAEFDAKEAEHALQALKNEMPRR